MKTGPFSAPSDGELLRQIAHGRAIADSAFERLYARHARRVLAYLCARCPADERDRFHRAIWDRVRTTAARLRVHSTFRSALTELTRSFAANRSTAVDPRAESLRAVLANLDAGVARLVRARLTNESYGAIGERMGHPPEELYWLFQTFRRRLTRRLGVSFWSFAVPDDPSLTAGWLERHLVGAHLSALIAELSVIHAESAAKIVHLAPLLHRHRRQAVLEGGLAQLSGRRVAALLAHPRLLLDLQDLVLSEGGRYWNEVRPHDDRLDTLAERTWAFLAAA
jgi:hypothetical protein